MNQLEQTIFEYVDINNQISEVKLFNSEGYSELRTDIGMMDPDITKRVFGILKKISKNEGNLIFQLFDFAGFNTLKSEKLVTIPFHLGVTEAGKIIDTVPEMFVSSRYAVWDTNYIVFAITEEPDSTRIFYKSEYKAIIKSGLADYTFK